MCCDQSLLQCECEHVTEHGEPSIDGCFRYRLPRPWIHRLCSFLLEIRSMRARKLPQLEMSDNVLYGLQPFFLKIRPRVADFAIFFEIHIREFQDGVVLRLFLSRQLLSQFLPGS